MAIKIIGQRARASLRCLPTTIGVLVALLGCVFAGPASADQTQSSTNQKQPNIVFILADDLGWQDVGFMGCTCKNPPCTIIRKGEWKLLQFLKKGNVQLFNTQQDQKESVELSQAYPKIKETLLAEMVQWRKQNDVPLPPSSSLKE